MNEVAIFGDQYWQLRVLFATGLRNCGRRYITDLLCADDTKADPPDPSEAIAGEAVAEAINDASPPAAMTFPRNYSRGFLDSFQSESKDQFGIT
jgi:hypothetical protein